MADSSLFDTGKAARFTQQMDDVVISDRAYNATIGGVVLWGILVNVFMCLFCVNAIMAISPIALLIGYFVCAFGGTWIVRASHHPIVSFVGYNLVVLPFGALPTVLPEYGAGSGCDSAASDHRRGNLFDLLSRDQRFCPDRLRAVLTIHCLRLGSCQLLRAHPGQCRRQRL